MISSAVGCRPVAAFEKISLPSAITSNRPAPDGMRTISSTSDFFPTGSLNAFTRAAAKLAARSV